jgi:hypothetical protein
LGRRHCTEAGLVAEHPPPAELVGEDPAAIVGWTVQAKALKQPNGVADLRLVIINRLVLLTVMAIRG